MERIAVIMGKMNSGGKKNLVMEYYRNIDRNKIQFDFICDADSNSIPIKEIEMLGGRVYKISPYQKIFHNISDIRKICKNNKYKIIHAYNGTMNVFSLYAAWKEHVPIRINESISMAHKADKKTFLKKILKPFSKVFSTNYASNGEICGRWQFGDKLFDDGKVAVFKTVIDTEKNKYNIKDRVNVRQQLGVNDNLIIGHIGRLTAQKNTLFLIDIFIEILKKEPTARLLIIGDGDLKKLMIEKIKCNHIEKNVIYLGRREDIQQFYNAMDCFVLPSLYEGLPVVGVEAQACGLPVFFSSEIPRESSAIESLGEFIDLKESADVWATKILNKMKKETQRNGCDVLVKNKGFDSKTEADKLVRYYETLLE